ncbi:MAG: DUF3307 domain-containing protein [Anaerolineales bacterium]
MAVFWTLLLSHLLGDFVLQSDRLVEAKHRFPGLLAHGGIHLTVSAILLLPRQIGVWVVLVSLTGLHLAIDSLKISRERPQERSSPTLFLLDQAAHLILIAGVAIWIRSGFPSVEPWLGAPFLIPAVGLTLVTFVWLITEQIFVEGSKDESYARELTKWKGGRMVARSIAFLGFWSVLGNWDVALLSLPIPYLTGRHRSRALLTDLAVAAVVAVILRLAAPQ